MRRVRRTKLCSATCSSSPRASRARRGTPRAATAPSSTPARTPDRPSSTSTSTSSADARSPGRRAEVFPTFGRGGLRPFLRLFGALRALFFEERGLVLHVARERVHDGLGEAEDGGAEDDAGDAEGVDARHESDQHPVEVEALGAARGELRAEYERGADGHRQADEEVDGGRRGAVLEDEEEDADGDVDGPLAEQREEADEEGD